MMSLSQSLTQRPRQYSGASSVNLPSEATALIRCGPVPSSKRACCSKQNVVVDFAERWSLMHDSGAAVGCDKVRWDDSPSEILLSPVLSVRPFACDSVSADGLARSK